VVVTEQKIVYNYNYYYYYYYFILSNHRARSGVGSYSSMTIDIRV